jgi:nitrate reductase delta subunit
LTPSLSNPNPFKKKGAEDRVDMRRVKDFTRSHFRLGEDDTILVTELACTLPGCAPLETVIAFWTADGTRHHYKVFKPVHEVTEDDLPPWWMKNALVSDEMAGCNCC